MYCMNAVQMNISPQSAKVYSKLLAGELYTSFDCDKMSPTSAHCLLVLVQMVPLVMLNCCSILNRTFDGEPVYRIDAVKNRDPSLPNICVISQDEIANKNVRYLPSTSSPTIWYASCSLLLESVAKWLLFLNLFNKKDTPHNSWWHITKNWVIQNIMSITPFTYERKWVSILAQLVMFWTLIW